MTTPGLRSWLWLPVLPLLPICLLLAASMAAQGGIHRGPGEVVPPDLAAAGRAGVGVGVDLTDWRFWWEFNKERFFHEARAGRAATPVAPGVVAAKILPPLLGSTGGEVPPVIRAAALLALGKVARRHQRKELRAVFLKSLRDSEARVRDAAILALGVAGMSETILALEGLARDDAAGRKLFGGPVPDRCRTFACHSLGLVAARSADLSIKQRVSRSLVGLLGSRLESFDVEVGAIQAISILDIAFDARFAGNQELRRDVAAALATQWRKEATNPAVRSHIPIAIARLIGRGRTALHDAHKNTLLTALDDPRTSVRTLPGVILALGQMTVPSEEPGPDQEASVDQAIAGSLRRYAVGGKDQQSRYFALIALGQIGGDGNRRALIERLTRGLKSLERPWAAMALGELEFGRRQRNPEWTPDEELGKLLVAQANALRNPVSRAAIAVALGMCRYDPAAADLSGYVQRYAAIDVLCGYSCIGLALLDAKDAPARIRAVVTGSARRRPDLLRAAASALGVLRDPEMTKPLIGLMQTTVDPASGSAIAAALAAADDPAAIDALVDLLGNASATPLARAFAATALGGIAEPDPLPFYARIASGLNYRAAVPTLVSSGSGLLEQQ